MFDEIDNKKNETTTPTPTPPAPTENQPAPAPKLTSDPVAPALEPDKEPVGSGEVKEEIHTMPMEYYLGDKTAQVGASVKKSKVMPEARPAKAPKQKTDSKMKFNIVIAVVVIVVVCAIGFILYTTYNKPANVQNSPTLQVQPAEVEQPQQADEELVVEVEEKVAEETVKFDPADLKDFQLKIIKGTDIDNDGLTDEEELLFGTNESLVDTDSDTYTDADEIRNFYSPVDKGSVRLWDKSFVGYYSNEVNGYTLMYPTAWFVQPLNNDDLSDIMFTSNQNEFVNIIVLDKSPGQSLENWYLSQASDIKAIQLNKYKTHKELNVLESPDGFTVYVESFDGTQVYALNYNIGLKDKANFPAVFQLMVNSFELTAKSSSEVSLTEESEGPPPVIIE